ncbi:unnamed protein product [Oikopleura dioica]|uniref:Uncharacterized protein n=1 Tax=Oikopleura dioica TaxID=34765 RepID=E4XPE7_OIKDI|nr:unnamed protein product [Oikopleura dioica]
MRHTLIQKHSCNSPNLLIYDLQLCNILGLVFCLTRLFGALSRLFFECAPICDCDDSTDVEDAKSTASSGKRVRFRISSEDDESDEHEDELGDLS